MCAHCMIVFSKSGYFEIMLHLNSPLKEGIVTLEDESLENLWALLHCIYVGYYKAAIEKTLTFLANLFMFMNVVAANFGLLMEPTPFKDFIAKQGGARVGAKRRKLRSRDCATLCLLSRQKRRISTSHQLLADDCLAIFATIDWSVSSAIFAFGGYEFPVINVKVFKTDREQF
ncbi:uncharacterized protein BKA78DRAFT_360280 [Phyllosticta capitalensis]|uniref:uncharacterized protein n=1 Tax=Phyllosticta capitalensis TaxID=121624 RepID=UPI003131FA14